MSAEHGPAYCCTFCDWLGFMADAEQDASVAQQGALCPDCFSTIEPVEVVE